MRLIFIKDYRHQSDNELKTMNIESIITGLFSLLAGLVAHVLEKPKSAREKRDIPLGLSEAKFKVAKWTLIVVGTFSIIYGLFNE